jgi:hypothetical protein
VSWTLRKTDGQVFEDRSLDEIIHWARSAQVNPYDEMTEDGRVWKKAFDVAELEMEWLVTLNDGTEYGPTNSATVAEFVSVKLLSEESVCTHRKTQQRRPVMELIREFRDRQRAETVVRPSAPPPAHPPSAPVTFAAVFGRRTAAPSAVEPGRVVVAAPAAVDYQVQPLPSPLEPPPPVPADAIMPDTQLDLAHDENFLAIERELLQARSNYDQLLKKYEKLVQKLPKNPAANR